MSNWVKATLGDLITLQRGFDITKASQSTGLYPVISSSGVTSFHDQFMVEGPGVVIGRKGTLGTAFFVPEDYWPHDTTLWVKDFKGNDAKFIYYLLQILSLEKLDSGSANPTLNRNYAHLVKVAAPDTTTQQGIAAVLSTLNAKIDLNNRINAELEALAKTIYDYWFVQFDFPDTHGRPYKSSGGAMVWNDTLKREIPAGWTARVIGEVLLKQPTSHKVPTSAIKKSGLIPVVDQSTDFICGYTDDVNARIDIDSPHVVFGDHTRIVKLVCFDYARGADGTQVLVPNTKLIAPFTFFQSVSRIDLSSYGYARHFKFLKNALIVAPEIQLADKYDALVKSFFVSIESNRQQNVELTQLRDWLLPLLMNGQVRVL